MWVMLLQEFNARLSHGYFMSIKNQRDAIRRHVDDPCTAKHRTWVVTGIKKDGTAAKRWYKLTFVSESGFSAFELSQNMHQLHFVGVARKGNNLILLHNPTKIAWRKSLRHAPIKENLIVKIEISYSSFSTLHSEGRSWSNRSSSCCCHRRRRCRLRCRNRSNR